MPAEVAALEHVLELVTCPVEDVLHVRRRVLQVAGAVPLCVFGRQACQVGQVEDVGVGEGRETEAVGVADGHGGEHQLFGGFLAQRGDMGMRQVRQGARGRLVQEQHQRGQQGQGPENPSGTPTDTTPGTAAGPWHEHMVNSMQRARAGESCQILHRAMVVLLDQVGTFTIRSTPGTSSAFLLLLGEFNLTHKLDRHGGSFQVLLGRTGTSGKEAAGVLLQYAPTGLSVQSVGGEWAVTGLLVGSV